MCGGFRMCFFLTPKQSERSKDQTKFPPKWMFWGRVGEDFTWFRSAKKMMEVTRLHVWDFSHQLPSGTLRCQIVSRVQHPLGGWWKFLSMHFSWRYKLNDPTTWSATARRISTIYSEVDDPCSIYMSSLKRRIGVFEVIWSVLIHAIFIDMYIVENVYSYHFLLGIQCIICVKTFRLNGATSMK